MLKALATAVNGRIERLELENALQLQRHRIVRPEQIKLKVAEELEAVASKLSADKELKKRFDSITLTLPT